MGFLERFFRNPRRLWVRRWNFQAHLWLGILLTLYLALIGVTGSILVFRAEIERAFHLKSWRQNRTAKPAADIETVIENVRRAYPRGRIVSVDAPSEQNAAFVAVVEGRRRIKVACDPTDGRVLGESPKGPAWLNVVHELHANLLMHRPGRIWNGLGAAFLLALNATGLVIWWPGIRHWARALKVDFGRNWRRINFDLHSAVGFWTILITSLWALSGIYFAWPRSFFLLVDSFSPVISARPPAVTVAPESAAAEFDLHAIVDRAHEIDPGATLAGIAFPYGPRSPLGILMRRRSSPGYEYMDTAYFNPYNGEYISIWRYGVNQSVGDWVIWSQVPLHFGTYWGVGVKLLWAAVGLAIPLLAVTGLLMYWNRALRRKWRRLRGPAGRATRLDAAAVLTQTQ